MAHVSLVPTGQEFLVGAHEDILTAALRSGINVRYGCRHGNCSSCKQWLVDGEVDASAASCYAIPRSEIEDGAILLCCTFAKSDLVIEIDHDDDMEELPPMVPPSLRQATVRAVRALTSSLVELRVEVDRPLGFRAGQYAEFTVDGTSERRSYSLVNPPSSDRVLVFCIKRIEYGVFSGTIDRLRPGWQLSLEAPFGTMFLRDTGRPVLAAAIGSGIAPIMSILTDAAEREVSVPIRLYYGARTAADLPYVEEIATLSKRLPDFEFIPCLSGEPSGPQPGGRLRRVTRVIAEGIKDASAYDAYLCGAPEMCDAVGRLLEAKGLPEGRIHADRFYPAIPAPYS